jgi:hypothetical protein
MGLFEIGLLHASGRGLNGRQMQARRQPTALRTTRPHRQIVPLD